MWVGQRKPKNLIYSLSRYQVQFAGIVSLQFKIFASRCELNCGWSLIAVLFHKLTFLPSITDPVQYKSAKTDPAQIMHKIKVWSGSNNLLVNNHQVYKLAAPLGGNSQTFLKQILKISVTLGLNILRFLRLKVVFKADIIKGWC